jgi:4'-phosphopantetheinyl transferase
MITVYFTSFGQPFSSERLGFYLDQVPFVFREQILRYRRWEDLHASLLGKLLLGQAFSEQCKGKPCLEDVFTDSHNKLHVKDNVYFNISHSGSYVVCAFGHEGNLGIDIEKIRPVNYSEFTRVFTDAEMRIIENSSEPLQAFYTFWAKKEAVIKADGRGMSMSLKEIEIRDREAIIDTRPAWFLNPVNIHTDYACWLATGNIVGQENIKLKEISFP